MSAFDVDHRPQGPSPWHSISPAASRPPDDMRRSRPPERQAPAQQEGGRAQAGPEDHAGLVFDHDGGYTYEVTPEGWFEIVAAPGDKGVGYELTPDGEFASAWQTLADYVEELDEPDKKPHRRDPWRTGPKPGEGRKPKGPDSEPEEPSEDPEPRQPSRGGGLPYTVGGYPSSRKAGPNQFKGGQASPNLPIPLEDGNEKITAPIARGCRHLAEYLPAGVVLTSGWRTHEEQANLIVDFADAGGLIDGDLAKTYDVASGKKDIAWVGDSAHQSGLAFDLSGASLSAIEAAVKQCMEDHPEDGIIDTLLESANNCVHVEVRG